MFTDISSGYVLKRVRGRSIVSTDAARILFAHKDQGSAGVIIAEREIEELTPGAPVSVDVARAQSLPAVISTLLPFGDFRGFHRVFALEFSRSGGSGVAVQSVDVVAPDGSPVRLRAFSAGAAATVSSFDVMGVSEWRIPPGFGLQIRLSATVAGESFTTRLRAEWIASHTEARTYQIDADGYLAVAVGDELDVVPVGESFEAFAVRRLA